MEKANDFVLKIFKLLMKPEMRILPAHLAFFLVITLIPLIALIATIAAALSISTESIRLMIINYAPKQIAGILNSIVEGGGINLNMVVFYFSAFLLASNGAYSMINSSNEIYKVKPRSMISRRIKAVIMTLILVSLFIFLLLVPVFGSSLFETIMKTTGNGIIIQIIKKIIMILKYPIVIIILFINIKIMYIIAPDQEIPSKTANRGAVFTTLGWILSTEIFAFYIEKFTKYDIFYGSISNILVLLLWVYLLSYIFVLGMVINASNYKNQIE